MKHARRGGYVPRASNIPWAREINDSNERFKRFLELKATLSRNRITPDKEVIGYCRKGERASHGQYLMPSWILL
jgi:thiosulfate/3-mercaptopyruvate sulfurtransferase